MSFASAPLIDHDQAGACFDQLFADGELAGLDPLHPGRTRLGTHRSHLDKRDGGWECLRLRAFARLYLSPPGRGANTGFSLHLYLLSTLRVTGPFGEAHSRSLRSRLPIRKEDLDKCHS